MTGLRGTVMAISLVFTLGLLLANADAQGSQGGPPAATGQGSGYGYGPGMMGMMGWRGGNGYGPGMMGMMYGYGDDGARVEHVEGRLAFIKAELKITAQQTPLWDKFAETVRANAKTISERRMPLFDRSYWTEELPQRLDQQEKAMTAHLDALRQTGAAIKPLYAALDDAQKKTADALLGSPMMGALGIM